MALYLVKKMIPMMAMVLEGLLEKYIKMEVLATFISCDTTTVLMNQIQTTLFINLQKMQVL